MSLDLYAREISQDLSRLDGTKTLEPSAFDGFLRGTSIYAMKGLAKTARAIDMAGAPLAMAYDAFTGGTEAQDRYFKEHDEALNSAVDYWTPKPLEVGVAAEIAGGLLGQLPLIIASPHLAVGAQVLDTAEDLARQNVDAKKAVAAGIVQGAGLATGIWMPILGQNAFQRLVIGGAGFNVLQGAATRGVTGMILEGTPAAEEFKAFDGKALTLDVLLGFAFGGVAHLSPAQRAHGAAAVERIKAWAQNLSPSEVAAIATLRTAQHLNEDSAPGRPVEPKDVEAHVERVRTAIDQLAKDQPVEVSDLPAPDSNPDPARFTAAARRAEQLEKVGERVRKEEGIEPLPIEESAAAELPAAKETEAPAGQPRGAEPPPPRGPSGEKPAGAEVLTPERVKADLQERRFAFLPKQVENMKYNIARIEEEIPALEADATRKVSKGDKVGASSKQNAADVLKRKQSALEEQRAELADAEDMIATGRRPEVPGWEVEFAIEGMGEAAKKAAAAEPGAGAETKKAPDPLEVEATRIATENPDLRLVIGTDADGKPITKTAAEYLAEADGSAKALQGDQDLLRAAAACLLGIA